MDRLSEIIDQIDQRNQPPVHLWNPSHVGEIDIRIEADGNWFHEGSPIVREELVKLFASILWCEDESHFLVTPVEKLAITVLDVPFVVHQAELVDGHWAVVTNTHEQIIIGENHPVELRKYSSQWVPYVKVRYDLWARVNRTIYYQWVDSALEARGDSLSLSSGNYSFEVAKIEQE